MLNSRRKLFLTSFLILFLELTLIRFLPSQVYYLGYYSNFILIASFVGIGGGILLAKGKRDYRQYFSWALLFLITLSTFLVVSITPDQSGEIHITSSFSAFSLPEIIVVPAIFILVSITFALLSQSLGKLLNHFRPLKAYSIDILGSLVGIAGFAVLTLLRPPPWTWFTIISAVFLTVTFERSSRWAKSSLALTVLVFLVFTTTNSSSWSPYQKITVSPWYQDDNPALPQIGQGLWVNNILHQITLFDPNSISSIYLAPYVLFNTPVYPRVLIIGAGTGNDVTLALQKGASHIDAVEIDPVIYEIGKNSNPNRPFDNQKVKLTIDDGRSFLEKSGDKYDLVIFALTDSLVLASANSTLRLESFLFTLESIQSAKNHLNPGGLLVLYNVYRAEHVIAKLASTLDTVFARPSFVGYEDTSYRGVVMGGEKLADLKEPLPENTLTKDIKPATDDWPFLYLPDRSIPAAYLKMIAVIGLFTYFFLSYILRTPLYRVIDPGYFFLGTAFLLLETKNLIQFSLLFGNTWVVNALVFFAILLLVLGAILVTSKITIKDPKLLYLALTISLLVQYFLPTGAFLSFPPAIKYLLVSLLCFVPIFFANIIFSAKFVKSKDNSRFFASNILGAAFGGFMEYIALILGYKQLIPIIILCYLLALLVKPLKTTGPAA